MKTEKFSFSFLTYPLWGIFALTLLSGIFLTVHYIPAFSQAFSSLRGVNDRVPFGWMFMRLHAAGGSFLLLLLIIHLLRVFYAGEYKTRPGSLWVMEVLLVLFTLGANFAGSFLSLSQEAFWGTAAALSTLSTIPWIGSFVVDFMKGGREMGGIALARFFSMHIGFSAVIGLLLFGHSRWGISQVQKGQESQFSFNLWTGAVVGGVLFSVITFLPPWFETPLKEAANPLVNPEGASSPWYFLFLQEALSYFNAAHPAWSLFFCLLVLSLLFALPYIDRNREKDFLLRPICFSVGSALVAVVVYFTFLGLAGAHYGEKVLIPKDQFSASEIRGARVFAQKNCAYCHQVFGRGGRREGPDMAVVSRRNRTPEWIQRLILNARLYQPGTTMPRYEIPLDDLEGLSAYLLSLDPKKRKFQVIGRQVLFDYEGSMSSPHPFPPPRGGEGRSETRLCEEGVISVANLPEIEEVR